jgi:hypothetical protein
LRTAGEQGCGKTKLAGSSGGYETMGIVVVVALTANATMLLMVAITATCRRPVRPPARQPIRVIFDPPVFDAAFSPST